MANAIKEYPGRTGAELSQILESPGAYRRLSEVKRLGLAKKGERRVCNASGKMADTWYVDDAKPEPDRGEETPRQEIKRLKARISFLEKENAELKSLVNEKNPK